MLTEPVECSTCKAVSVNGGVIHCHGCYSTLQSKLAQAVEALETLVNDEDRYSAISKCDGAAGAPMAEWDESHAANVSTARSTLSTLKDNP